MSLEPGTRLGRYEIRSKLGAGGMAEVYTAEDTELRRLVALKLLPPDSTSDEHARKRLMREARSVASLTHPHICAVYDVGEDRGQRFIAMQLVDGDPLDVRLARGRLSQRDALAIACDIADALAEAHERGVIHRDIKPSNVVVTARGGAVVLGFGLAQLAGEDERVQGDALTESAHTAPDIFGVGALLYEMIGGRRTFSEPTGTLAPDVSPELARIMAKALRKDPNECYQTAKDLYIDLRSLREVSGAASAVSHAALADAPKAWPYRLIAGIGPFFDEVLGRVKR